MTYETNQSFQVLHPFLHRVVSVREYLRAQGFPDSFDFDLEDKENNPKYCIRGVGNSVPVPFGEGLGDGLLQSLMEKFQTERREGRNSRSATPIKSEEFSVVHRPAHFAALQRKGATADEPIDVDADTDESGDWTDIN